MGDDLLSMWREGRETWLYTRCVVGLRISMVGFREFFVYSGLHS
jgi:hypothetical protein